MKDQKRYSFSRLKTFHICPLKHHYQYEELIEQAEGATTLPGKLFHECIELFLTDKSMDDPIKRFRAACTSGFLEMEPDTLEKVVSAYLAFYSVEFGAEESILVEHEFEENLLDDDKMVLIVDRVYRYAGMVFLRDMKTTTKQLKYTTNDVMYNQQLLLYVPYVEDLLKEKVSAIQIDEVRLAKLDEVPVTAAGRPTTDRKKLELVTLDAYRDKLHELGLDGEPMYDPVIEWMEQRGHPLFRRVTVQLVDDMLVEANLQDIQNTYRAARLGKIRYRVKGPLCNYCAYAELCQLDYFRPSDTDRKIIIEKISKSIDKE